MKRAEGFYWVKYKDEWCVGEWLFDLQERVYVWALPNLSFDFLDTDFDKINEYILTPPND